MGTMVSGEAEFPRLQSPGIAAVVGRPQGSGHGEGGVGCEGLGGAGEDVNANGT